MRGLASWEVSDRGFIGVLSELGLKIEEESFEEVRKIEDEKNERHGGVAEVAKSFELCVCEKERWDIGIVIQ
jgi:hypothetical protein